MSDMAKTTITASKGVIARMRKELETANCGFDFNVIIPMPNPLVIEVDVKDEASCLPAERVWREHMWGTKKNASCVAWTETTVTFHTPWTIPVPIFEKLCDLYSNEDIYFTGEYRTSRYDTYTDRYKNSSGVLSFIESLHEDALKLDILDTYNIDFAQPAEVIKVYLKDSDYYVELRGDTEWSGQQDDLQKMTDREKDKALNQQWHFWLCNKKHFVKVCMWSTRKEYMSRHNAIYSLESPEHQMDLRRYIKNYNRDFFHKE